jgi:glyoxylase-like metal-dependent hydrolase (beta-lactamase superfamily II)
MRFMHLLPNEVQHCQDRDGMRVQEIATGLWRWTGLHPEWTPAEGEADGWEQEAGCYFYEGPEAIVLFDPLVPPEDRGRFFEALDRDVERAGRPVRILVTVQAHHRSSEELRERYDAAVGLPAAGVEAAAEPFGELVYWLPEHRAIVVGDLMLVRDGVLTVPRPWFGDRYEEALGLLRPLLDLPIERVLVTHGEPVLEHGHAALSAALASG